MVLSLRLPLFCLFTVVFMIVLAMIVINSSLAMLAEAWAETLAEAMAKTVASVVVFVAEITVVAVVVE